MALLSSSYVHIMKKVYLTCFSSTPLQGKYGIDGGRLGTMGVSMPLLSPNFGKAWVDLQQRLPFCRLPGWSDRFLFSGTSGWKGIAEVFVIPNWIALNCGG